MHKAGQTVGAGDKGEIVEFGDGTKALIRPIQPGDRERLQKGFESASEESRFRRFLAPLPRLSSRQLDYLTVVDHVQHEALIAVDPESGQSFGTARYVCSDDDPETAEFAVGVGDQWMRIGLGTALLTALVRRARTEGIKRVTGVIQAENTAIKGLVAKVGGPYVTRPVGWGVTEIVIDLAESSSRASVGGDSGALSPDRFPPPRPTPAGSRRD
jgi:protein lysine acetyltransferase